MSSHNVMVGRCSFQGRARRAVAPTEGRPAAPEREMDRAADRFAHRAVQPNPLSRSAFDDLMSLSPPVDGRDFLSRATSRWLAGLENQLPRRFWIHRDASSRQAADMLGARAFTRNNHIFLGDCPADEIESVLRH